MKEEYLHFSFKWKMLGDEFVTHQKSPLKILDFGEHNQNAGPDFLDAKICYDGKVWVGAIEFHINASDWYKHKHQNDPAYGSVIAHFVYNNDAEVKINDFVLPTVEIKEQINLQDYDRYEQLQKSRLEIPCENQIKEVSTDIIYLEKYHQVERRLWKKALKIIEDMETYQGDRNKAYLLAVARAFGGKVNQIPFEQVVTKVKTNWFAKLNYESNRIEALLFGLAKLLPPTSKNQYVNKMILEFAYQKKLFNINDSGQIGWKYSRMRPHNFPDVRLAQFIAFSNAAHSLTRLFENDWNITEFYKGAQIELNPFWGNHFRIAGEETDKKKATLLSNGMIDLILINAVVPFIYAIGLWEGNSLYKERAISLLSKIKPEKNREIERWKKRGVEVNSAFDSQSLLELKKEGCNRKKCLFCAIGKKMLKR